MPGTLDELVSLPEISFIDDITLEDLLQTMITDYNEKYSEITGETKVLSQTSPFRALINSSAMILYQILVNVDAAGKKNTLKYSYGNYLDSIGALKRVTRNQAKKAHSIERFYIEETKNFVITIPNGTRVTQGSLFFETTESAEIIVGNTYVDIMVYCTEAGVQGNDIYQGEIKTLVDPVNYISKVENITTTTGGSDTESDDSLADRIFLAPSSYSLAGTTSAYEAKAKEFSQDVIDVKVDSTSPGIVDIRFILTDGELPGEDTIRLMEEYLSPDDARPLTDKVVVNAPDQVEYNVDLQYWIRKSDSNKVVKIQQDVENAVNSFIEWQKIKIGRDINDTELVALIKAAGAKRCIVNSPIFKAIGDKEIAKLSTRTVTYGGMEND
nr:baseplate J/gp47 family protein [uncultured Anaerosporobacter sp.]